MLSFIITVILCNYLYKLKLDTGFKLFDRSSTSSTELREQLQKYVMVCTEY